MKTVINVADIIEANGKTWRENNLAREHNISLGTLVELESGVRLFVIDHSRDCDGEPLYNLSYNLEDLNAAPAPFTLILKLLHCSAKWTGGYGETSLKVINSDNVRK